MCELKLQAVDRKKQESPIKRPTAFHAPSNLHAGKTTAAFSTLDQAMSEHILEALKLCRGKIHGQGGAAELLGVNSNTFGKDNGAE